MQRIPKISSPSNYSSFCLIDEEFLEVKESKKIEIRMQYYLMKMRYSTDKCILRRSSYKLLLRAASMLPDNVKLCILDAWRPYRLQEELYDKYFKDLSAKYRDYGFCDESIRKEVLKYVSEPVYDRIIAPVHTTGGAVDITLLDSQGNELDMGTTFDDMSPRSSTAFFEDTDSTTVINNRRLLYHVMTKVGFTNLPTEWWHYDYGDRFWAYYQKKQILYGGAFTIEDTRLGFTTV